jgi:hypothetical protein
MISDRLRYVACRIYNALKIPGLLEDFGFYPQVGGDLMFIRGFCAAFAGVCVLSSNAAFAGSDFLAQKTITIASARSADILDRTVADIRGVFQRYQPAIDSQSKIVSPLRVTGSASQPEVQVSIQKCIFILCQTVDLDAEISVQTVAGSCAKNFVVVADLHRSSGVLTDYYDRLEVTGCYKATTGGQGQIEMSASAHQASGYRANALQREIFKVLQEQVSPILRALDQSLKANSELSADSSQAF